MSQQDETILHGMISMYVELLFASDVPDTLVTKKMYGHLLAMARKVNQDEITLWQKIYEYVQGRHNWTEFLFLQNGVK